MAKTIVSLRVMPESPDVDLKRMEVEVKKKIVVFAGEGDMRVTVEPVAFGLNSVNIIFVMEESQGSTEPLEIAIQTVDGVNSVEVTDVRRAIG